MKREIISYCNQDIVPDEYFDPQVQYRSDWFVQYFSFLDDDSFAKNLGEAFYQARFLYKLMTALSLPKAKAYGIIKFQIIQYASIYEAILDYLLNKYFKAEIENRYANIEYSRVSISASAKITYDGAVVELYKKKAKNKPIKLMRIQNRLGFAVEKRIISQTLSDRVDNLYDTRNNIHILKAMQTQYKPRIVDSKLAFELMEDFVDEVKLFCRNRPQNTNL